MKTQNLTCFRAIAILVFIFFVGCAGTRVNQQLSPGPVLGTSSERDLPNGSYRKATLSGALKAKGADFCRINAERSLECFGDNEFGQRGGHIPFDLGPVQSYSSAYYHTCAVDLDGLVKCWGSNMSGECDVPKSLGKVKSVLAGREHTCALKAEGEIVCWGDPRYFREEL